MERSQINPRGTSSLGRETFLSDPKKSLVYSYTKKSGGGIFGTCSLAPHELPRSDAEKVYYEAPDVSEEKGTCLAIQNEAVVIGGVSDPKPEIMSIPKRAGNEYFMIPKERREMMRYEIEMQKANKLRRKAFSDTKRMIGLLKSRHRSGVLGMKKRNKCADASVPFDVDVYRNMRATLSNQHRMEEATRNKRTERLKKNTDVCSRRGYNPFHHCTERREMLSVSGSLRGKGSRKVLSIEGSNQRLFGESNDPPQDNQVGRDRLEFLRSRDRGGRQFNIVSGKRW
eukprot:g2615.t1